MDKNTVSATIVINDFNRRGIKPYYIHDVTQGTLSIWMLNNSFIAALHTGDDGSVIITGQSSYCNTTAPQAIADDLITESRLTSVDINLIASQLGRLGGSIKSKAKANASRANGKLGGRPKKAE